MKAYTKKSHVRESANDKIFGFVISLILILFAVITAIPLISEVTDESDYFITVRIYV
mgnify:CR=1 FL=1